MFIDEALSQAPSIKQTLAPVLLMSHVRCQHQRSDACTYRVAWQINPHMKIGGADPLTAFKQHSHLRTVLERVGAQLHVLPFIHAAYDSVFTKDMAVLLYKKGHRHALLANPKFAERRKEQRARKLALERLGFTVSTAQAVLEGGDVIVLPEGKGVLLGCGPRTSLTAQQSVERFFDREVTPLTLKDDRFFHLDVALTALADGSVLACREAFTAESWATLERHPHIKKLIEVPTHEALEFSLNLVEVHHTVIVGGTHYHTLAQLQALGKTPVVVPLDQFHLAGGSAACLTLRLHR